MAVSPEPIPLDTQWLDPLCELLYKDIKAQFHEFQGRDAATAWVDQRAMIYKLVSLSPSVALMLCRSHVALPWEHLLWLLEHRDVDTDILNVHVEPYDHDVKLWTLLSHPRVQSSLVKLGETGALVVQAPDPALLSHMTSLQSLSFRLEEWQLAVGKHDLSFLSSLRHLTALHVGHTLEDNAFEGLAGSLTALKHLIISCRSARFLDDVPSLKTSLTRLEGSMPSEALQSCLGLQYINISSDHPCFQSLNPLEVFPALRTAKTIKVEGNNSSSFSRLVAPRVSLAVEALCIVGGCLTRDTLAAFPCLGFLTHLMLDRVCVEPGHEEALRHFSVLTAIKRLVIAPPLASQTPLENDAPLWPLRHITAPLRELEMQGGACLDLAYDFPVPPPFASTLTRLGLLASGQFEFPAGHPDMTPLLAQLTALRDLTLRVKTTALLPLVTSPRLTRLRILSEASRDPITLAQLTAITERCGRLVRLEIAGKIRPDAYHAIPPMLGACTRIAFMSLNLELYLEGTDIKITTFEEARASEFGSMPESWREALSGLRFIARFSAYVGISAQAPSDNNNAIINGTYYKRTRNFWSGPLWCFEFPSM